MLNTDREKSDKTLISSVREMSGNSKIGQGNLYFEHKVRENFIVKINFQNFSSKVNNLSPKTKKSVSAVDHMVVSRFLINKSLSTVKLRPIISVCPSIVLAHVEALNAIHKMNM